MIIIFYDIEEITLLCFSHTSFGDFNAYENLREFEGAYSLEDRTL